MVQQGPDAVRGSRHGTSAGPTVVKPNAEELARTTGLPVDTPDRARLAADALRVAPHTAVVVSLGPDGLVATTPAGDWYASPPTAVAGNPTGAGDACVAAIAAGLAHDRPWPEIVTHAVAVSAASVAAPTAGEVDVDHVHRLRVAVRLTPAHALGGHSAP